MSRPAASSSPSASGPVSILALLASVGAAALAGLAWSEASATHLAIRDMAEDARAAAAAAERAATAADESGRAVADLRLDFEMLTSNVGSVETNLARLAEEVRWSAQDAAAANDLSGEAPSAQPLMEYTPELREALRKAVATKGVRLLEDRVVIPGEIVLRQGALEYFAVLPGGKTHESVLLLQGESDTEGTPPRGLGAALNSCLQALGLAPGTPLRILPGGRTIPAKGTTVHIAVEWDEDGERVRVRAEDLLWDRERGRTLEPGKFLYVGSFFDMDGYVPDLAGDAVAVYSVPSTVIDLDDPRAAVDTIFVACAPRIPPIGTPVDVIFSPEPLTPTRTWDPDAPVVVDDADDSDTPDLAPAEDDDRR